MLLGFGSMVAASAAHPAEPPTTPGLPLPPTWSPVTFAGLLPAVKEEGLAGPLMREIVDELLMPWLPDQARANVGGRSRPNDVMDVPHVTARSYGLMVPGCSWLERKRLGSSSHQTGAEIEAFERGPMFGDTICRPTWWWGSWELRMGLKAKAGLET